MTENTHGRELDALKAEIANLREEIAGLVAGARKAVQQEGHTPGEEGYGAWTDLLRRFDSSRIQGEKVVKDLAAEVEQRPLGSIMAAFGLGYIVAKLWCRGKANEDTNDAS